MKMLSNEYFLYTEKFFGTSLFQNCEKPIGHCRPVLAHIYVCYNLESKITFLVCFWRMQIWVLADTTVTAGGSDHHNLNRTRGPGKKNFEACLISLHRRRRDMVTHGHVAFICTHIPSNKSRTLNQSNRGQKLLWHFVMLLLSREKTNK